MKLRNIKIITWKDLLEVRQNKSVVWSMALVPVMIIVLLPLSLLLIPAFTGSTEAFSDPDMVSLLENLPASLTQTLQWMGPEQITVAMILGYLFAPMFMILPLMLSTSIAAESFAGERERKTLEGLLYTSASDAELFIGKALAAFIPAVLIAWISFVAYIIVLNAGGYPLFGRIWFPFPLWYPIVLWVTPALAALGVGATVLISIKVQTFMGAYQASASLVVLVLGLIAGQATGLIYLSGWVSMILGLIIWLAAGILIFLAIQQFNRKKLLLQKAR